MKITIKMKGRVKNTEEKEVFEVFCSGTVHVGVSGTSRHDVFQPSGTWYPGDVSQQLK